ncbi:MAG: spheroidene monooxygenase [Ilumatobacteraceae bacterium]
MGRIASFHLVRWSNALQGMGALARTRFTLRGVDGLEFWRVLGTGNGDDTSPSADLSRTALFLTWRDEDALHRFLREHAVAKQMSEAKECWHVKLRSAGGMGSWKGRAIPEMLERGSDGGPIAIITRAHVRARSWRVFGKAGVPVDRSLKTASGLLGVVGIGETPVGMLGTFSLWRSLADMKQWAYESPQHQEVMRRTRDEGWYGEEMFARFEPYDSTGTWDGANPLA